MVPAPPVRRPFLIVDPSWPADVGTATDLDAAGRAARVSTVVLRDGVGDGRPAGPPDPARGARLAALSALAGRAVAGGADLLAVAGPDAAQAAVASVASRFGVPLLPLATQPGNRFARDLGLDDHDPTGAFDALVCGVETRVDLGRAGGLAFVDGAAFGDYAALVCPSAATAPAPLRAPGTPAPQRLQVRAGQVRLSGPRALLVTNNAHVADDITGAGRREALDRGELGVLCVTVADTWDAAWDDDGDRSRGCRPSLALWRGAVTEVVVDAVGGSVPVNLDGEVVLMPTPLRCRVQPAALRVRLPRSAGHATVVGAPILGGTAHDGTPVPEPPAGRRPRAS